MEVIDADAAGCRVRPVLHIVRGTGASDCGEGSAMAGAASERNSTWSRRSSASHLARCPH